MNVGISVTWNGIITVASSRMNSRSRSGKRNRAKPNATNDADRTLPAVARFELQHGKDENNHEQNPCQGAGVTHLQKLPAVVVQVEDEKQRAVGGSAARNDVRGRKHLKTGNDTQNKVEEDERRHHRY